MEPKSLLIFSIEILQTSIMTTTEIHTEEKKKILKGLEKAYEKLLEFKKKNNSVLVVMRDNQIVKIKPE